MRDTALKSIFFGIPVLFVQVPNLRLLVDVRLLVILTLLLFLDLLSEEHAHACLVILHFLLAPLLELTLANFFLLFVARDHVVFEVLSSFHLPEHVVCHLVHEFLCAGFTRLHLTHTIRLHLILHLSKLILGSQVVDAFLLLLLSHHTLLLFVFIEHLLQVFTLLSSLLHLHLPFLLHFVAEASDLLLLVHKLGLIRGLLSFALLSKLKITRELIIHDLIHNLLLTLLLAILE